MINEAIYCVGFLTCLYFILHILRVLYVSFFRNGLSSKFFSKLDGEKWAIITGAGNGIGKGYAEELAAEGYDLILLGRRDETLRQTEESVKLRSANAKVVRGVIDFSQPPQTWTNKVKNIIDKKNILLLVNNVGMNTEIPGPFIKHDNDHFQQMIECNCVATLEMTQTVLPLFQQSKQGGIIFLSSVAGQYASPYMSVYSATKAFILRFAEALSAEVSEYNVDVLILHPFYVKSNMSGFRKTSFTVCSANAFARLSFPYLGRNLHGQPYWPHRLLDLVFVSIPLWFSLIVQKRQMVAVIGKLERRKNKELQRGAESGQGGYNAPSSSASSPSSSSSSSSLSSTTQLDTEPFLK